MTSSSVATVLTFARNTLVGRPVCVRLPGQVVGTQTPLPPHIYRGLLTAHGCIVDVVANASRRRKGGKFDLIIAFRGRVYAKHVAALSAMRTYVQALIRPLVGRRLHRRRKPFYLPASTQCNANQDMLLWVGGQWRALRDIMPTPVRELRLSPPELRAWIARTQTLLSASERPPPALAPDSPTRARMSLRARHAVRKLTLKRTSSA